VFSPGRYVYEDEGLGEHFQQALRWAVYSALPDLGADGPVWRMDIPETRFRLAGTLYYQSFNRGSVLLLFPRFPDFPFQTRIVAGLFLEAFLAEPPGGDLGERLFQGLAHYGFPLTDAYPTLSEGAYREEQRFTRGTLRPIRTPE
jgi:hypothetical protein